MDRTDVMAIGKRRHVQHQDYDMQYGTLHVEGIRQVEMTCTWWKAVQSLMAVLGTLQRRVQHHFFMNFVVVTVLPCPSVICKKYTPAGNDDTSIPALNTFHDGVAITLPARFRMVTS